MLFPEPTTRRTGRLGRAEPGVHWFTESTRPEAVAARALVNTWYERFDDRDGHFAAGLQSEVDVDHYQALDELHLHHLLVQQHDDVRYEEGGRGPDFRIYENGTCIGAIEVMSLFQRQDWADVQLRHGRLADELDARVPPTAGYFAHFQLLTAERDPSPKRFADFVTTCIAGLPPHDQAPRSNTDRHLYREDGVTIELWFSPMKADAKALTDPDGRISGFGQVIGGFVNTAYRLRSRLNDKARKLRKVYQLDGLPFVVAVGVHDIAVDTEDVVTGLYGSEALHVSTNTLVRQGDGFFGIDRLHPDGRRRGISGVLVLPGLPLGDTPAPGVGLYLNPFATAPWPAGLVAAVTRTWGLVERTDNTFTFNWLGQASPV